MSKYSAKQNEWTKRYIKENLEEVRFRVRKGERALIAAEAESLGMSVAAYLTEAVNEKAGRQILTPAGERGKARPNTENEEA